MHSNPIVDQATEIVNRSTSVYIDQSATRVPIDDPLPGLKLLGYGGSKAKLLRGADASSAIAIKGLLLEGYAAIPDCSYTDFGARIQRDDATGYYLASVVLAGA